MLIVAWLLAVAMAFFALAYLNAVGWVWTVAIVAALAAAWSAQWLTPLALLIIAVVLLLPAIILNIPALRRKVVSDAVLTAFRKVLPPMSQTERDAIEAGTVWWDGELFSGNPRWSRLLAMPRPRLTADEQRFLDHECEELCAMVSDWETTHVYRDLPPAVWQYVKDKGFLGNDHPEGVWRARLFRLCAFAGDHQAIHSFEHGSGDGDGAQFSRAGRAAAALRHR